MDRLDKYYKHFRINILIIDYRGYGGSTGSPSENGFMIDADAVMNYALNCGHIDPRKLILFGKSLGGAVATYLAEKYKQEILALILENTFTSIASMVDQHMPFIKYLKSFLLTNDWNSLERIQRVERPILFVYGEYDEIINNRNTVLLYESAKKTIYKEIYMVPNGNHNSCDEIGKEEYLNRIKNFIDKISTDYRLIRAESIALPSKHIKAD